MMKKRKHVVLVIHKTTKQTTRFGLILHYQECRIMQWQKPSTVKLKRHTIKWVTLLKLNISVKMFLMCLQQDIQIVVGVMMALLARVRLLHHLGRTLPHHLRPLTHIVAIALQVLSIVKQSSALSGAFYLLIAEK